jgi:arginyl-tRNA synthetase
MESIRDTLEHAVQRAIAQATGSAAPQPAIIRECADPRHGDYQANGILPLAKKLKQNPRELAAAVAKHLAVDAISEPPQVAGAGFINFRLKKAFIEQKTAEAAGDERLGVPSALHPQTIVIDFSSPNVAKPMHVGHIRSTILGDTLASNLRFLGHRVITDNHIGDWGTQFGKLIVGWKKFRDDNALQRDPIAELERLSKHVNQLCEQDATLLDEARRELAKLQAGDAENLAIWKKMGELSQHQFDTVYARLGVRFDHALGESFYNPRLKAVVDELRCLGVAEEDQGAMCIFFRDHPELKKTAPFIIQKADGAFLYATTDLATILHRVEQWQPDEIIYVTDARQQLHFRQLFEAARRWFTARGELARLPKLTHVYFGSILGEDGKPFKTRAGDTVKLTELLDEAEERALAVVNEKNPELPETTRREIARVVGLGAVKYADLSQNRITDYIFSWDKMLAMTGNTAPYLQYAYVRVRSIFRKAGNASVPLARDSQNASQGQNAETSRKDAKTQSEEKDFGGFAPLRENILLQHPAEIALAKHLLKFPDALEQLAEDDKPNWLTSYLYDLATQFSAFYDNCPVLQSEEPLRTSRLTLCRLTADILKQGLDLLGIETIEQM